MAVDGHGPAWQAVIMLKPKQQTWPLGQSAALVHERATVPPSPAISSVGRFGLITTVYVFGPLLPELHAPTMAASTATAPPVRDMNEP